MTSPDVGGEVTSREVYQLVLALKAEVLAEVRGVAAEWNGRMTAHDIEHRREYESRNAKLRWAVTTIIAVLLGVASILAALMT